MTSSGMQAAIDRLQEKPCECIHCDECRGTGQVWFSFGGPNYGKYLGHGRWDDLDEMETCETCRGRGTVDRCERCCELNELYEQQDEIEERAARQKQESEKVQP